MIGGVSVNFILALFIYVMLMFAWGETYVQTKDMKQGFVFNEEAKSYGFKDHDILVGTENGAFKDFGAKMYREISKAKRVDIIRDGKKMSINLTGDLNLLDMIKNTPAFCLPYVPANIDSVMADGPAAKAGIKKGDKIVALNGTKITSSNEFTNELSKLGDVLASATTHADSMKVRTVTVGFIANGADTAVTRKMVLTKDLKLAVGFPGINTLYTPVHKSYGFFESIPAGIKYGWDILHGYVSDMKYVFTADGAKSLGGFGAIGSMFPSSWDWYVFWKMTAFLSIILAFMNILPIPALDGGHVLFLIYEIITGRKLGEKFMIRAEYIGISILILLMIVANLNDILRWLGYMH
jgi:regulator of sigma E protease